MYKIESGIHRFTLTFGGMMDKAEMERWREDSRKALDGVRTGFGVFVDMRTLSPLLPDVQAVIVDSQKLYKDKGMVRSVVILDNAITTLQFKSLAKKSGIYAWERYIDASSELNWKQTGLDWITKGIDPDK